MNVLEALIDVIPVQLATTLKGVILALATLDTQAMDLLAQVSAAIQSIYSNYTLLSPCITSAASLHSERKCLVLFICISVWKTASPEYIHLICYTP